MKKLNGRAIAVSAMIAAVYTAVSLALSLASFGVVQIRVAECLTLLPVLSPLGIYGVTVGCLLTNLVGAAYHAGGYSVRYAGYRHCGGTELFFAKRSDQKTGSSRCLTSNFRQWADHRLGIDLAVR